MSTELPQRIPAETIASIEGCRDHSRDLLKAARLLKEGGYSHFAYHLAVLGLEELGKADLIGIASISSRPDWALKRVDDHVKKLFWALWGPSIAHTAPSKQQIESLQGLATRLHENRLRGLYVDPNPETAVPPKEAISNEALEIVLGLLDSRINVERPIHGGPLDPNDLELLSWLDAACDDPEKRSTIFSAGSMAKLSELGSGLSWIGYLKEEFDKADADGKEMLAAELRRQEPLPGEALRPKWKFKIHLKTTSHSVRPRPLNEWNARCPWIQLFPRGNEKDGFLAELSLPHTVSLEGLWWAGLVAVNSLLVAMNIGTAGFVWHYVQQQVSKYYDKLVDLDSNTEVTVERSPALRIKWPHAHLSEDLLLRSLLCLQMMPGPSKEKELVPYAHYLAGLAFLGKTDVHFQFEPSAYHAFAAALRAGMLLNGDHDASAPFEASFHRTTLELLPAETERSKHLALMAGSVSEAASGNSITLREAFEMKLICDAYFLRRFHDQVVARKNDLRSDNQRSES